MSKDNFVDDITTLTLSNAWGIHFDTAYEVLAKDNEGNLGSYCAITNEGDVIKSSNRKKLGKKIFKHIEQFGTNGIENIFIKNQPVLLGVGISFVQRKNK